MSFLCDVVTVLDFLKMYTKATRRISRINMLHGQRPQLTIRTSVNNKNEVSKIMPFRELKYEESGVNISKCVQEYRLKLCSVAQRK